MKELIILAGDDESQAEEVATNSDWLKEEDKHYCPDCYFYDDADNLILRKIDLQSKKNNS